MLHSFTADPLAAFDAAAGIGGLVPGRARLSRSGGSLRDEIDGIEFGCRISNKGGG